MTIASPVPSPANVRSDLSVEQTATPGFELILSGLESAPPGVPFESEQIKRLTDLYTATREHHARLLNAMLDAGRGTRGLLPAVVHGAQMLHRRLANAFGEASLRLAMHPRVNSAQNEIAELALKALNARAEEIKWHAFERTKPPAASWEHTNRLYRQIESRGAERQALAEGGTCVDAFGQCILLATLNVGVLNAPAMELAHRWLAISGWGLRAEPFFDPEIHWYQIDLEQARGPERISSESAVSDATRFIAVYPLGPALAQARAKLYTGELSVPATPNRIAALHFGAFLDLAERLWSPDWRRATWRTPRTLATGENIEVVSGFDRVMAALNAQDDADAAAQPQAKWMLHDRSESGLGALLPEDTGASMQLGALVAYRASADEDWQLGTIVRRVRATDETFWLAGIKRIGDAPVALELKSHPDLTQPQTDPAPDCAAIYASLNSGAGRIDSLLLAEQAFTGGGLYRLPTRGGAFRIKMNRVIDRGDDWVRVGFEVLGKQ